MISPLAQVDFYKTGHYRMYVPGMTKLVSNFTPRKSRLKGVNSVVVFGIQYLVLEYLISQWNKNFFNKTKEEAVGRYMRLMKFTLGKDAVDSKHIEALWDLQYLPLEIKALPEGTLCPIGIPCMVISNTEENSAWLVNYLETIISAIIWGAMTSATTAREYRLILDKFAMETVGNTAFTQWQGHDFSARGMFGMEAMVISGMAHLLSFTGTDTVPAIEALEEYYGANIETELVGGSVPATEHSVMCMGTKDNEIGTIVRLLDEFSGPVPLSIVADTWNLWKVCTVYLPLLKKKIMRRGLWEATDGTMYKAIVTYSKDYTITDEEYFLNEQTGDKIPADEFLARTDITHTPGKLVIRPDSGDPVKIITGYRQDEMRLIDGHYYEIDPKTNSINIRTQKALSAEEIKGVTRLLYEVFGGTENEKGYIELDPHIGSIYGDSITLGRCTAMCQRHKENGFASTVIVFGIGSFTYQGAADEGAIVTRDLFGFAMKATYGEVRLEDGTIERREIWKDPITDDGTKKSAKGLILVYEENGVIKMKDQCTEEEAAGGLLEVIFRNGVLIKKYTLADIRARLNK